MIVKKGSRETRNTKTKVIPTKIGRGNAAEVTMDASPPSPMSTPSSPP
jgi:hypothetical protein